MRVEWDYVTSRAAQIVESYDSDVTLRQLFYRLVSAEIIPNTQSYYNNLSAHTAQARREGWFPSLIDNVRRIHRSPSWDTPASAMDSLIAQYRRDRTDNQTYSIYIAVEKNALANLLKNWFNSYGIGVLALGGYSSQTYVDDIQQDVERYNRPAILIYGGDFDASGQDLFRDFQKRTDCWDTVIQIALNKNQIIDYDLPPLPGKRSDTRARSFIERHGELIQVELDALPPNVLRKLYEDEFHAWWEDEEYQIVLAEEKLERKVLESYRDKLDNKE